MTDATRLSCRVELSTLASAAELKTGSRVLDVGAGTGRVALALADCGCSVVAPLSLR